MTYRKRKFFVQLIVNFNEIQHYTWLGTFWNCVYKYTYTCKFTKNFYIHCSKLAFLLLVHCYPCLLTRSLSIILSLLLYSSFTFIIRIVFRHLLFHLDCILPPEYHDLTRFLVSTRFLTGYLLEFYQIFLRLPDFLRDIYLISTRFSCVCQISYGIFT